MPSGRLLPFILVAPLLCPAQTPTPAPTPNCDYLTYQALTLNGTYRELEHASELAGSDAFLKETAPGRRPDPRFVAVLRPILVKTFDGEVLKREIRRRLVAHCHPQIAQVVEALKAPLVARMVELEADAADPKSRDERKSYIASVGKNPPEARMKAIQALDKATGSSDLVRRTTVVTVRGMLDGVGEPPSILAQVESHVAAEQSQLEKATQLNMLFTYRNVSTADLENYAKAITTEPLKSFARQVEEAMLEMFEQRCHAMGQEMRAAYTYRLQSPARAR
jgi:hypothetical protein